MEDSEKPDVLERQEIVIGLIGPLGTDLKAVETVLARILDQEYKYDCKTIKISDLIRSIPGYASLDRRRAYEYYTRMIQGGNYICEQLDDKGALAEMAVESIHKLRETDPPSRRRAFIIHSLKRPAEVQKLRELYGSLFYAIGVFADVETRTERLSRNINSDYGKPDDPIGRQHAQHLVQTDERENTVWGQKVSDTFAQADYFIRGDEATSIKASVERFLTLVFGKPYCSPNQGEVAMMHAFAAGLRSADLSRQIGAVVAARDGRILTTGCNEVPSPGGGQYWASDPDDKRDFKLGHDINDLKKRDTIVELLGQLDSVLLPDQLLDGTESLYERLEAAHAFSGTRADSLIEFGRVSHAEMSALNGALLETISIWDGDLYCTTFPCHMCTRLIIGAGIRNVFYIEPYPKSAALELYGKHEIVVNPTLPPTKFSQRLRGTVREDRRTYFFPFEGVAPRRYTDLFSNGKQKADNGDIIDFDAAVAKPRRMPLYVAAHLKAEEMVAVSIAKRAAPLRKEGVSFTDATRELPVEGNRSTDGDYE